MIRHNQFPFHTLIAVTICLAIFLHSGQCELPKRPNRYLAHLFNKYGSQGTISFEGLEHLMHNLGLGGLEFNPKHTIDEHRAEGFKLPNVIEDDESALDSNEDVAPSSGVATRGLNQNTASDWYTEIPVSEGSIQLSKTDQFNRRDDEDDVDGWMRELSNDNVFKTMHDPKHRHPRHHEHGPPQMKTCLSPKSLIQLYVGDLAKNEYVHHGHVDSSLHDGTDIRLSSEDFDLVKRHERSVDSHESHETVPDDSLAKVQITPAVFMSMCPALLVQIEQGSCNERHNVVKEEHQLNGVAWLSATISVFLISMCGLVGIAMVPLAKSSAYQGILRFLVACAIGTLCGDALMHLLPHALTPHQHDHGHDNEDDPSKLSDSIDKADEAIWLCACAFMSALAMYSIETLLPLVGGDHGHGHDHGHSHNHHHSHSHAPKRENVIDVYQQQQQPPNVADRNGNNAGEETDIDLELSKKNAEENVMVKDTKSKHRSQLSPVAFMVIIGDGLHNLTDGMAIGAAFGTDPVTGMATAFAVLCHELPHELGDFALLLQTGVSIRRAVFLNIVSSVLSFIGMVFGLVVAGVHGGFVRWIYAGTAGTFLYIALADLVPELGRSKVSAKTVVVQIIGILLGGIIMLCIGLYEEKLKVLFE